MRFVTTSLVLISLLNTSLAHYDEQYLDELKTYLNLSRYSKGKYCDYFCDVPSQPEGNFVRIPNPMCHCEESPECESTYKATRFTFRERREILHVHNRWRNRIAKGEAGVPAYGRASMMFTVNYDVELEAAAHCLSLSCMAIEALCKKTSKHGNYGQNLFQKKYISSESKYTTQQIIDEAVFHWVSTGRHASTRIMGQYQQGQWDSFTQVAWGKSAFVGCAVSEFQEKGFHIDMVVCNYFPAGNIQGERVFEPIIGDMAVCRYPHKRNQWYSSLCGEVPYSGRGYRATTSFVCIVGAWLLSCVIS